MSTAARIDELRKKFEENPRRYFAPLANEYRKAGDLLQAIALCREFLPKQPGHMSGFIVFGQSLYEAGEIEESRSVFEQALSLDPENLIALRHLGDIARASGDAAGARRWYERVLDADPRNDDIAAQLSNLAPARAQTPPSVDAPTFESIARMTPPIPMDPIGFAVVPTPDSVMRAVDFDAFGSGLRNRTPIDLDAFEDAGSSASAAPPEAEASEDDPWVFPDAVESEGEAEAVSELDAPAQDDDATTDADFEEGLIAANWPDTSELVARVQTPRSVTPVSVTPLSSAALYDATSAFGREPEPPAAVFDERDSVVERSAETSADAGFVEPPAAFEPTSVEMETPVTFDAITDEMEVPGAFEVTQEFDASSAFDAVTEEVPVPTAFDMPGEEPESIVIESTVDNLAEPSPLPWIAFNDTTSDQLEDVEESEPGLEEIAEVFADDARAAGDQGAVTVAALEDPAPSGESESFADVAHAIDDEAATAFEEAVQREVAASVAEIPLTPATGTPAFVTETMGELLVAQGFVARAVDVYDELVRRRPFDPVLSSRLDELRAMVSQPEPEAEAPVEAESSFNEATTELEMFASPVMSDDFDFDAPTPAYGTPVSATPVVGISALSGQPYRTPAHPTPGFTQRVTPLVTPAVTPYAQPAVTEDFAPRRSAGEWFAALAARRVPRRTPAQSAPAVDTSPEGLASLFGDSIAGDDDTAARALADAFAPVSEQELESGAVLDFEFARATPAFSHIAATPASASVATPPRPSTPASFTPTASPPAMPASAGNAGFSFDKFFPDPATRRGTPEPAAPAVSEAPVTDDLAQFSAWLKGLGNS